MAHISSIGAAIYSDLSICMPATDFTAANFAAMDTAAEFAALFLAEIEPTGTKVGTYAAPTGMSFIRVDNVRSFPPMGTPPNIVKVPNYGQATSSSIQGQSDAPQLEIDLNYVPLDWAKVTGNHLGNAVGNGVQYLFRFSLLQAKPTTTGPLAYATVTPGAGIGSVANSLFYWYGKIEALLVTPSLTDAATAKLSLSIQSSFYGAYTFD